MATTVFPTKSVQNGYTRGGRGHPVYISSTRALILIFNRLHTPAPLNGTEPLIFFTISQILLCTTAAELVKIGLALVDALNSYLLRKEDYRAIENEIPDMR
jgi:hypothetical protein